MATARTPRDSWVDQGLVALAAGGPEAVRIEPIATALGVTKGGFYWHFTNREALLDALLDTWEREVVDEAIDRVEQPGGDARTKLRRLFGLAATGGRGLAVELAVRDWSRRDVGVADRLRRVDNRRMAYLRLLFAEFCPDDGEVEARSMTAMALSVGSRFIAADHGGRSRTAVLALSVDRLLV